jgi:hypothetical protein
VAQTGYMLARYGRPERPTIEMLILTICVSR